MPSLCSARASTLQFYSRTASFSNMATACVQTVVSAVACRQPHRHTRTRKQSPCAMALSLSHHGSCSHHHQRTTVSPPCTATRRFVITRDAANDNSKKITRDNPELEERFATIGAGEHECSSCMYQYSPKKGDDYYPVSAGTAFGDLPADWRCPVCGAEKTKFKSIGKKVAGFEQNQGYGFGTNSMTEGEKSRLIYGGLITFFGLFLSGYLLD